MILILRTSLLLYKQIEESDTIDDNLFLLNRNLYFSEFLIIV